MPNSKHHDSEKNFGSLSSHKRWATKRSWRNLKQQDNGRRKIDAFLARGIILTQRSIVNSRRNIWKGLKQTLSNWQQTYFPDWKP